MKKKVYIGLAILVTIIGISLLTFKPEPVKAGYCDFCFNSFTNWPGNDCDCYCAVWNYMGKDPCGPVEPQ